MNGGSQARSHHPGDPPFNPEAEARSPPGQWALLAVSLIAWAVTSWMILEPGRGTLLAILAGVSGTLLLIWIGIARVSGPRLAVRALPPLLPMALLVCAAILMLGTRVSVEESHRADPLLLASASSGEPATFDVRLTGFPERKRTMVGDRAWVRGVAIRPAGPVPILLWLDEPQQVPAHWAPGVRITVTARLKTQAPQDAAAFTAKSTVVHELAANTPATWLPAQLGMAAAELRHGLVRQARQVPGAELVPGFAVGDTSLVSEHLHGTMLESSLTHLTAVSGSNTGLVIAAVVWSVSRLGMLRRSRTIAAFCGLLGFIAVVGPDASVQRAAVMASVLLIGNFGGRRATALPALGCAALTLLALDPWQALQAGFALSVAATGGILICAAPLAKWLRLRTRFPNLIALPVGVAVAAQLFCGPLLLLLQPGVPAAGIVANVVAAPAAPLGTGLGLLAALLYPIAPPLASFVVHAASWPARWVAATAEVCATLPAGRWHWPGGWEGALLLAACQLGVLAAWALATGRIGLPRVGVAPPRSPWQSAPALPAAIRTVSALLLSSSLGIFLAFTLITPVATTLSTPRDWVLVACDIGQGDAVLVREPEHSDFVILIDTGDDPQALERCLNRFGVTRIGLLVLTHDDRDHVGALGSVVERVDHALISPTVSGEDAAARPVVQTLERSGIPYRVGAEGDGGRVDDPGPNWQVLAPRAGLTPSESNESSLVLVVEAAGHRMLMLADTGYQEQHRLRDHRALQEIDVIKVAHHGSKDQDPAMFGALAADWGVVSVGAENTYGHPNPEILAALERAGTTPLRTDLHGSVALLKQPDGTLAPWVEDSERAPADVARDD